MATWRDCGATGHAGTCLWCGSKLRAYRWRDSSHAKKDAQGNALRGGYNDGFFCGLRCGYEFGVTLAKHGRRVEPAAKATP